MNVCVHCCITYNSQDTETAQLSADRWTKEIWYICVCECVYLVAQLCPSLCNPMDCSLPGFFVHGDYPGKNTGVGCHALLQGIFPTQVLNQVSHIAGGFFTL